MKPSAFCIQTMDNKIRDYETGNEVSPDFHGRVIVYYSVGKPALFKTGVNKFGERWWWCIKSAV